MTLHTEEQAREKWCPFAWRIMDGKTSEVYGDVAALTTHSGAPPPMTRCIASDCMAWKEKTKTLYLPPGESPGSRDEGWQAGKNYEQTDLEPERRQWVNGRTGYCGLAGQPE